MDLELDAPAPATDDRVRTDGGNSTEDLRVPQEEFEKMKHNAVDHGRDEPGS
jgi:hypothetical protein